MLEFIDLEMIKMNVFAIFASLVIVGIFKNIRKALTIYFSILLLFSMGSLYYMKSVAQENIQSFKKANELKCTQADSEYRVSIDEKWIIDKNYFIKDSLMIRADKCEIFK